MSDSTSAARDLVLGIDLGTTYSSAGVLIDNRVEMVRDEGDDMIPSVVHLPERGPPLVGRKALMRVMAEPAATVQSIKRLLGCSFDDPTVRQVDASVGYGLEAGEGGRVQLRIRQTSYACEQIVAYILGRLRELAERRFGARISRCVVTVPASASEAYHAALRRAARIAHLEVLELLPEPVAGALALGLHGEPRERGLLVCDFGGGTFDASLVIQSGLRFQPVAIDGDPYLGGDDLDQAMCDAIAGAVRRRSSFDMMREATRRQLLLFRCESVKRQLSQVKEAPLTMKEAYVEQGAYRDIDVLIERSWIEPLWAPLFARATAVVERLVAASGWGPEHIHQAVLVGGTALVPSFQRAIQAILPGTPVITSPVAHIAVALGAVLQTGPYVLASGNVPVLTAAPAAASTG
mgnify:CR=1 FL=1